MQDVCLHVSARLESNDSGLIYMTFWKGAVRRQRKTDCLDCAFSPATTALFTVLLQKLARDRRQVAIKIQGSLFPEVERNGILAARLLVSR